MLKIKDFVLAITDDRKFYLSFEFKDYEICFEPCLSGYCVAIYRKGPDDRIGSLVEEKKCTDFKFKRREWVNGRLSFGIDGLKKGEKNMVELRALKYANEFYKKYNN